ncbi:MAG: glycosyltransferase family 4 protein [Verrucomicrobiales bacterium]
MRIMIFASEFPPQPGGIGSHAWSLGCEMHRRGFSVLVITDGRAEGKREEQVFDASAPFEILRIPFGLVGLRQLRRITLYLHQLRRWKPDCVIASGRFPLLLVAGVPTGVSKVAILHGTEAGAPESVMKKVTLRAAQRFAALIPVSRFTRDLFELDPGDPRVAVIPNGVSGDRFVAATGEDGSYSGSPCLTTVGNVTYRKGQDNVIRALPTLLKRYPDAVYHIAGIPTEKDAFLELAQALGVEKHIVFHGAVSNVALAGLLRATDVFLMLSSVTASGDVEGFGIAILEANLLGVPAIGARGCGIEDAIDHGVSGMLVDAKNPDAVADAVDTVMKDRASYSLGALDWVGRHSWAAIGDRYEDVLVSLTKQGAS